jgi:geranylgeranyl pyrophosphate synthase
MKPSLSPDLPPADHSSWWRPALVQVEQYRRQVLGQAHAFGKAADYQAESTGKRLRPTILLCFSCLGQPLPRPRPAALRAAAVVELLHEASLIHDDVLDRSLVRRGRTSVPEKFGVFVAARLGAFLVATAMVDLADVCEAERVPLDVDLLRVLSEAQLEEGLCPPRGPAGRRQRCLRVIQGKTASLFKLSAQVGAALSEPGDGRDAVVRAVAPFAEHLALAFQLRDDLADLESAAHIRKPGGNDLLGGLPTLPFQMWADSVADAEAVWERLRRCRHDSAAAAALRRDILGSGVPGAIRATIGTELWAARAALDPVPACPARDALDTLLGQLQP